MPRDAAERFEDALKERFHPHDAFPGITLRDWFAGMALAGLSSRDSKASDDAKDAYCVADAMLRERDEPRGRP